MFLKRDEAGKWVFKTNDGDRTELSLVAEILSAASFEGVGSNLIHVVNKIKDKSNPFAISIDGHEYTFTTNIELYNFAMGLKTALSSKKIKEKEVVENAQEAIDVINKLKK